MWGCFHAELLLHECALRHERIMYRVAHLECIHFQLHLARLHLSWLTSTVIGLHCGATLPYNTLPGTYVGKSDDTIVGIRHRPTYSRLQFHFGVFIILMSLTCDLYSCIQLSHLLTSNGDMAAVRVRDSTFVEVRLSS